MESADASFEAGDVAMLLADYLPDHDALVVDPPRKGIGSRGARCDSQVPTQESWPT
jgi:tRNA/tmRNA/rRNA uracil-C5-methylase (TrmA/RlmC/RlmD family)